MRCSGLGYPISIFVHYTLLLPRVSITFGNGFPTVSSDEFKPPSHRYPLVIHH